MSFERIIRFGVIVRYGQGIGLEKGFGDLKEFPYGVRGSGLKAYK